MTTIERAGAEVDYRQIPDYPNYRVGNDGSVWCNLSRNGKGQDGLKWRRLRPHPMKNGHLLVTLRRNGAARRFLVHRLVLMAFVGPCPVGMEGCHYPDRDPANNRVDNLRWDTHAGNMGDTVLHGTSNRGEKHPLARLTEADVRSIRNLYATGKYSHGRLGREFMVHRETIGSVVRRESWRHV